MGTRPVLTFLRHPILAICAVQAAVSLSLVWSNTAFGDEAWYLWIGRLAIDHWLHPATSSWPSQAEHISGSAFIYPPLAALVSDVGGLAAARILSLTFMLVATVLLYLTATRLIGKTGALFAAGVWALSEPVLRLAFATFDPMSVFLTAVSGYLIVQAGYRRRRIWLLAASSAALALANATAFSGIVIDPAVVIFSFLVWQPRRGTLRAAGDMALLGASLIVAFVVAVVAVHSTAGLDSIFHRTHPDQQSLLLVSNDVWKYSGLAIVLALIGAGAAVVREDRWRAALLVWLGGSILVVPLAQLDFRTGFALDKHLAYGIWFAAIAAGYGAQTLIRWVPGGSRRLLIGCCVVALSYPAISSWETAWDQFHSWANASSFVSSFSRAAAGSTGLIYAAGGTHIAQYYTPQGDQWRAWSDVGLSLAPSNLPRKAWKTYYQRTLRQGTYSVIALFYNTTFSAGPELSGKLLLNSRLSRRYEKLEALIGSNTGQPGLPVLTLTLEKSRKYHLVSVGPYDTSSLSGSHDYGVYAIWTRVPGN